MFDKLEEVENRYEELNKLISNPDIIADQNMFRKYMKEQAALTDVVEKFREYKKVKREIQDAEEMMQDPEMKDLAEVEFFGNKEKLPQIEEELKLLLLPKDINDDNNVIIEIRGRSWWRRGSVVCI